MKTSGAEIPSVCHKCVNNSGEGQENQCVNLPHKFIDLPRTVMTLFVLCTKENILQNCFHRESMTHGATRSGRLSQCEERINTTLKATEGGLSRSCPSGFLRWWSEWTPALALRILWSDWLGGTLRSHWLLKSCNLIDLWILALLISYFNPVI